MPTSRRSVQLLLGIGARLVVTSGNEPVVDESRVAAFRERLERIDDVVAELFAERELPGVD